MKMMIKSITVLVTAIALFLAPNAKGAEPQVITSIPQSLEMMGSEGKFLDWCVSNRLQWVAIKVRYKSATNVTHEISIPTFEAQFASYAEFRVRAVEGGLFLREELLKRTNIASEITFAATVYVTPSMEVISYTSISIFTNIGNLSGITSNTFAIVSVRPNYANAGLRVPGLERFTIRVDSDPPYSYGWTNGVSGRMTSLVPPPLPQQTTKDLLILRQWYSVGGARTRFTIESGGQVGEYTQHGALLVPAKSVMVSRSQLDVQLPTGSEAKVEYSTNLLHWSTLTNLSWQMATNRVSLTVNPNLPEMFFRTQTPH